MTQKAFELSTSWNNSMNESPLSKKKMYNLDDDIVDVIDSDDGDSDIEFFKQTKKDQVIETVKDLPHAEKETPVIIQQNLSIQKDEGISNHLAESSSITTMEVDYQPNFAPTNEMDYVPDYFTPSNDYFDDTPATPAKENVSQVKGPSPKKVTKKSEESSAKGKKKTPTKTTSRTQSKNKSVNSSYASSATATIDLDDGNEANGKQLAGTVVAKEAANGKKIKKRVVSFVKSCDLVNLEKQNLLAKAYLQISFEDIKLETIRSVEMHVDDVPTEAAQPLAKKDLPKKMQPVSSSSGATTLTVLKPLEAAVDLTKVSESTKNPTAKPTQLNGSSTSRSTEMNGNTGGFAGRNTNNLRVNDQDISRDNRIDSRNNQRNDYHPQQPAPPPSSSRNDDWYSRKSPPRADSSRGDRSDDRWVVDRRPDYGDRAAPYDRYRQRSRSRSRSRSPTRKNPYDNQRPPIFESSRSSVPPPASRSDWEEWERRREREAKEHSIISQQREQARIERERERERAERGERSNPRPAPYETSRSSYIDSGRVSNPVPFLPSRVVVDNGKRNEMEEWERRREQESKDHASAAQKREQARIERERVEKERFEKERRDREKAAEREKTEKERLEKERKEREKAVRQKEAARLEKERAERLEKERIEKERLEKERKRKEKEQRERERIEREREEEQEKIRLLQEDRIATQIFQQQRRDKAIEEYLGAEDGEIEEEPLATPVAKEDQEQEDSRVTWE
eukprot:gene7204-7776_t